MKNLCNLPKAILGVLILHAATPTARADNYGLFTYTDNGTTITITNYPDNATGAVEIPGFINAKPVISIGSSAFSGSTGLTSVTIPDSVTSIGTNAFSGCTGLSNVTIPNSVASIGTYAFSGCTGLSSVTIPNSVTSIGTNAFNGCTGLITVGISDSVASISDSVFRGCTGLITVTIPDSVTSIGPHTFNGCTGLTSVTIGNSVISIGNYAFYGCTSLTSVTIPNSVTSIGTSTFYGCTGLNSFTVGSMNPAYSSANGVIFNKTATTVAFYPNGKPGAYEIPNNVTAIGTYAFNACAGLTSVIIPDSVTSIGTYAFSGCTGLSNVTIGNSVTSIGDNAFLYCYKLATLYFKGNAPTLGTTVFTVSSNSIVYYISGTGGWSSAYGGLTTVPLGLPTVTSGPSDIIANVGENAIFNVIASTKFPLTLNYQWKRNGVDIPGATSATLGLSNIQSTNVGGYSVIVTNDIGSVGSSATLTLAQNALYTQSQYDAALQVGINAGLVAGRSQVIDFPNSFGLYSLSQVQALHIGTPLLSKDSTSGKFKLTIGVEKSTDLSTFTAFPIPAGASSINAKGEMEFQFNSSDNAAFFRLESH